MGGGYRENKEPSMKNRTRNAAERRTARVAPVEGSTEDDSGPCTSLRTGSKPLWACSYTPLGVWQHLTVLITSQEELKVEYL